MTFQTGKTTFRPRKVFLRVFIVLVNSILILELKYTAVRSVRKSKPGILIDKNMFEIMSDFLGKIILCLRG